VLNGTYQDHGCTIRVWRLTLLICHCDEQSIERPARILSQKRNARTKLLDRSHAGSLSVAMELVLKEKHVND